MSRLLFDDRRNRQNILPVMEIWWQMTGVSVNRSMPENELPLAYKSWHRLLSIEPSENCLESVLHLSITVCKLHRPTRWVTPFNSKFPLLLLLDCVILYVVASDDIYMLGSTEAKDIAKRFENKYYFPQVRYQIFFDYVRVCTFSG